MKKYLYTMLAMAAVLFTACTQEDDFRGNGNGDEVTVAFSVKMPTATTRAYNPGECIDELVCVVFENGAERYRETISGNNNFTFTPQLINGRTYDIVFWAQNTGAYDVTDAKAIKRNAGNFTEAEYDAFTYVVKNFQVTEENLAGNNVSLSRPFAQLNIGVTDNDLDKVIELGYTPTNVVLTVDNAATEFNALTGKQVNTDNTVSYTLPVPGETINVAGVDYNLLSQCFVLLEDGWPNANVTYEIKTADEVITSGTINNVPFDANYKTNIVGTLMTEKPTFNITIDEAFATPDNVVSVWDGESKEEITPDANGVYYVENAAQFAWLAGRTLEGKIVFKNDIDMANNSMDHITAAYGKNLEVVGNNHFVKNLNVTYGSDNNGGANGISLFYVHAGATLSIKDLTLEGISAVKDNVYAAAVVSYNEGTLNLDNVHVVDCNVRGKKSVGGLIGHNAGVAVINKCSVEGSDIKAIEDRAGGLVGRALGSVTITKTTVADNTVSAATNAQALIGQRYNTAVTCTIDGAEVVTPDEDNNNDPATLISLIANGASKILLTRGEFEVGAAGGWASDVEIAGADKETSVLKMSKSIYTDGKVTIKNLTYNVPDGLQYTEHDFGFIHHADLVVDNCNINHLRLNTKNATITNSAFKVDTKNGFDGYGIYYYGTDNSTVNVENCTFDMVSKGIVMYSESAKKYNLNVNECTFTASTTDDKAAIQMHSEYGISGVLTINDCTATGYANVNGGLWNEVNNNTGVENNNFSVFVDGKNVRSVAKIGDVEYSTLSAAFAAVTDDNQTVVILKDVKENLTSYFRGNITTENGAKVTIQLTNSDWVYCPYTFVLGENITLNVPALFYYAGASVINGTVVADAYYQRYGNTKLIVNEPGSLTVNTEQFYLRYTDGDPNAGIYVNGDNNDTTIGLKLSVAYFYQGMINAKDANIQVGTYWQTNETDGLQGSANLVLDNTKMNVTVNEQNFKATGNSTVTLTNNSKIKIAGGYEGVTPSVDETSSITTAR